MKLHMLMLSTKTLLPVPMFALVFAACGGGADSNSNYGRAFI